MPLADHDDLFSLHDYCQKASWWMYIARDAWKPGSHLSLDAVRDTLRQHRQDIEALGEGPFEEVAHALNVYGEPNYAFGNGYYASAPDAVKTILSKVLHNLSFSGARDLASLMGYSDAVSPKQAQELLAADCYRQIIRAVKIRENGDKPIIVEAEPEPVSPSFHERVRSLRKDWERCKEEAVVQPEQSRGEPASKPKLPKDIRQKALDRILAAAKPYPQARSVLARATGYRSDKYALHHICYLVDQGKLLVNEHDEVYLPPSLSDRNSPTP